MLGRRLDVRIQKGVYRGLGLARHDGRVVFVPRGLPGESVRVEVVGEERGYLRARVLEVLEPMGARRAAPCSHAQLCGGCCYQELEPREQLRLKQSILLETLRRTHLTNLPSEIEIASAAEQAWRLRTVLHADECGGLGLHEEGSHRVVPLERCWQISEALNRSALAIARETRALPELLTGQREVELIESTDGSARVAALECPVEALMRSGAAARLQSGGELQGIGCLVRGSAGRSFVPIWGQARVEAVLPQVRLGWRPGSFFQGNRFLLPRLVELVCDLVAGPGPLVDLYAGVGLFGLALSAAGRSVDAVESHAGALHDARENIARHSGAAGKVRLHEMSALAWLRQASRRPSERIVLDPPRSGAGRAVVQALVKRRPACLVYVSCDPTTLARDLALLETGGYVAETWMALDLFPDTFHLETVVRLLPR